MENKLIKFLTTPELINQLFQMCTVNSKGIDFNKYPYLVIYEFEADNQIFATFMQTFKKADEFCKSLLEKDIYSICYDTIKFPDIKFKIYSHKKLEISEHPKTKTTIYNLIMAN